MAAEELECTKSQVNQAAAIMEQLEKLRTDCVMSGDTIGDICCQITITALSIMLSKRLDRTDKEERDA